MSNNAKKILAGVAVSAAMLGGMASTTFAANDYCGASSNGCEHAAAAGAQCDTGAGSGAFGAFGKDNNFAGGANGTQTGLNNSALCGNRQGNLP
jgi:hypothetical protein